MNELPADEYAERRNQNVLLPGERETTLEQELAAIAAGDLARLAAQLHARQGETSAVTADRLSGIVQRFEDGRIHRDELFRRLRKGRQPILADGDIFAGLRHAAVMPACLNCVRALQRQRNLDILAALEVVQGFAGEYDTFTRLSTGDMPVCSDVGIVEANI